MRRSTAMSRSRPTATARRRPASGARNSTTPTCRAASSAATAFQFGRGVGPVFEAVASEAEGHSAVGRGSSPRLPQAQRPSPRGVGDLRGPARGAQPRHARSGAEGQPRHPGAADRLHDQREQPEDDGARPRARPGDPGSRRRDRHLRQRARSCMAAGICSAPRAWAPIPRARWSTNGAARTT